MAFRCKINHGIVRSIEKYSEKIAHISTLSVANTAADDEKVIFGAQGQVG